jgi:two-component system OmpR family response regulator
MLTARGQAVDRVVGLEMGADDYMAKPFDPRELLARIRAVLRRSAAVTAGTGPREPRWLRFAGWQLDTRDRQVQAPDGRVVSLGGADYRLLRVLLRHPHQPLGRDLLQEEVYGRERGPEDRAIDVCVSRLRNRLEADPRRPVLIRTLRNEGYQLSADVDGHD